MEVKNRARLILQDGSVYSGFSFGARKDSSGEVVFNTGMVGYPEAMTDPSYKDQILIFTYPIIGNYGVCAPRFRENIETNFESSKIHLKAIIVSEYSREYSHWTAEKSLHEWMIENGIGGITGIDTRSLAKHLREKGDMPGKIVNFKEPEFYSPYEYNLVEKVSCKSPVEYGSGKKKVILIDCGCKNSIIHSLLDRGTKVKRVPWNYDFTKEDFDGVLVSNGPGNPKKCSETIQNLKKAMDMKKPIFGICLGNQILALAAGATTYKLNYGHRSQNQPCIDQETKKCLITSQNHGFAIDRKTIPKGWKEWFINANDKTNEGIMHEKLPFMSVQFHPEGTPGPTDSNYIFDKFIRFL
ncbi:MAG: glutamine-hydrolyzing carbamoyl-phosphate synthase small subunit [Candidatus Nanoarchaeia archaeon]